jgi:hypothetical protein
MLACLQPAGFGSARYYIEAFFSLFGTYVIFRDLLRVSSALEYIHEAASLTVDGPGRHCIQSYMAYARTCKRSCHKRLLALHILSADTANTTSARQYGALWQRYPLLIHLRTV